VPLVLARYLIPILPLGAILLATALDAVARRVSRVASSEHGALATAVGVGVSAVAVLGLYLSGPLPALAARPDGFLNHKAYQGVYAPGVSGQERFRRFLDLKGMPVRAPIAVSDFYRRVAEDREGYAVVEYPIMVGDVFSAHFVAQESHRKRVVGGYLPRTTIDPNKVRPGHVYADMPIGVVIAEVRSREKIAFCSLVDVTDVEALRRSGARYLVIHKAILKEIMSAEPEPNGALPIPPDLLRTWVAAFGQPAFEDAWLAAFDVGRE
jgi:hypothetical protein